MHASPSTSAAESRNDAGHWLTPLRFTLLLALIIGARFAPVVLGRESFFYRDYGLFTFPIAHYFRDVFWQGELPLWNPYNNCGVPLLAQWNTALLYPPSLFYLLLPFTWALGVFQLLHLVFAGLGMYLLARKCTDNALAGGVAGIAFSLNGLSLHMLMWISNLAAYAWMPWVVLAVVAGWRRGGRPLTWAIIAGAMQMLSGAPELILLTWVFLAGVWLVDWWRDQALRRKLFDRTLLMGGLIAAISAAQLLPFIQLLAHSQRSASYGNSAWAMPGWGWANFLVPLFHCSPSILGIFSQDAQQWTASYYLGIGTVALALWAWFGSAPKRRMAVLGLSLAAFAGVILAMGENAPLFGVVKKLFPQLGVMRYPIKLVVLTAFVLPLLAAYGVANGTDIKTGKRHWLVPAAIGIVLAMSIAGITTFAKLHPITGESVVVTQENGFSRLIFLALVLGAVLFISRSRVEKNRRLMALALLLLTALDALTQAPAANPTIPAASFAALGTEQVVPARLGESRAFIQPGLQNFLNQAATPDAVNYYTTLRRSLFLNANLIEKIPVASGFFSLELGDYADVDKILYNGTDRWPKPLADFLGVAQISSATTDAHWTTHSQFMPWVTGGQLPKFATRAETLQAIASPEFQPRTVVYLPLAAQPEIKAIETSAVAIAPSKVAAQRLNFSVTAAQPAMVVIAQTFYAPWRAYVDGQGVKLWEANGAFQALEVPAGTHQVRVVYDDFLFKMGAGISLAGLALTALLGLGASKRAATVNR